MVQEQGNLENRTDEEIMNFLREEYGWTFTRPSYETVPEVKSEYVRHREDEVGQITQFLIGTYIINDTFGKDHLARREFKKLLGKSDPKISTWVANHSKLRGNKLLQVTEGMYSISNGTKFKRNHSEKRNELLTIFTPEVSEPLRRYNDMEFDEKVTYVKSLDDIVYCFLEALSR